MLDFSVVNNIITIQISIDLLAYSLIYLAGLLWGIELIPQVIHTVKTKDVKGMSPTFFGICLSAYFIYMLGNGLIGNWNIVLAHVPSLILWFIMLILIMRYRKNGKKRRKIK